MKRFQIVAKDQENQETYESSEEEHPFVRSPHRALLALTAPVLISLISEPLTGLVDTAFISRLGSEPLAALGVGTMCLTGVFWIFNLLGIGVQTEVAQALGQRNRGRARANASLALGVAAILGFAVIFAGVFTSEAVAALMGAGGGMKIQAAEYMEIRWLGAPAVLLSLTGFGVLRGLQDMKTPLWIALSVNALNMILDPMLIFGWGPLPVMGIKGAGLASTLSQYLGAIWVMVAIASKLGFSTEFRLKELGRLLQVGGDLFIRTGLLTLFLVMATRSATRMGAEAGAAHQAIRQVWVFTALFLDAFAVAGQSLVGYFVGAKETVLSRKVAGLVCGWSVGTGALLGVGMLLGQQIAIDLLVPVASVAAFIPAWTIAAISQPLNAISFSTDGIHWGTGDFSFLRNSGIVATGLGLLLLAFVGESQSSGLTLVWLTTTAWVLVRAILGILRIWPGIGRAPLALK